jgi:LmbE family N-acetylglucosaminyl deacetylase
MAFGLIHFIASEIGKNAGPVAENRPASYEIGIQGTQSRKRALTVMEVEYLFIAPHPDDAELGAGGTILLLKSQGARVGVLDLTDGEPTPFGSPAIRRQLAGVLRQLRPRILFAPYWEDSHPDHVAATPLIDAARFWAKLTKSDLPGLPHFPARIIYYFAVHLRIQPKPSFVVDISPFLEGKMQAIGCYRSQFIEGRPTAPPTFLDDLRDRARYWGWAIGAHYGEPFITREEVGLRSLRDLL